jgi:hypothetical protein
VVGMPDAEYCAEVVPFVGTTPVGNPVTVPVYEPVPPWATYVPV